MREYTWNEIMALSGIYDSDTPLERDMKFLNWIHGRKYRVVRSAGYAQEREWAIGDAVEILIIKD